EKPGSGGLPCRISSVSASLTSKPTGKWAWSSSSRRRSVACAVVCLPAARFVLVENLCRSKRVTEHDPFESDSELADFRFVSARAGLQDGEGAPNGCSVAGVLEQHDVVGEVRDAVLGESADVE